MVIKATASIERIKKLVLKERQHWEYLGQDEHPDPYDQCYHIRDKRSGSRYGYDTKENALKQMEISIAFDVLEKGIGIKDTHQFDWTEWCDDAEKMVIEIVRRNQECQEAGRNPDSMGVLMRGAIGK